MGETTITKELVAKMQGTVQNLYLADEIPWVIGYSGGKDSTAALQLVWLSIKKLPEEQRHKTIHIINTDTMVESPVVAKWAQDSLKRMDQAADEQKLPFVTHRLTPKTDNTFWVNLIGRGYPKTMAHYEQLRVRELLSPNPTLANELVFSPLEDWNDNDVWLFLMQYKNPWGYNNNDLLTMYRGATADGECPLMVKEGLPSCGKSRFGCWVCTMVEQDKSMEAMIANDSEKEWMTPLLEFRNEIGNEALDKSRRDFRRRGGYLQGFNGKLNYGPYTKATREMWLEKLLQMQIDINEHGPEGFDYLELITIPELIEIRKIWVAENHEFDDSLPVIYERVMGKPFPDKSVYTSTSFKKKEWDLLRRICEPQANDDETLLFEMMYTLIDIESKSNLMNNRKGILDQIERTIKKNFYRDADDASNYYFERIKRKKEHGAKYTDNILPETEEEFEDNEA